MTRSITAGVDPSQLLWVADGCSWSLGGTTGAPTSPVSLDGDLFAPNAILCCKRVLVNALLATEHNVSVGTVSRAIGLLKSEGLVTATGEHRATVVDQYLERSGPRDKDEFGLSEATCLNRGTSAGAPHDNAEVRAKWRQWWSQQD